MNNRKNRKHTIDNIKSKSSVEPTSNTRTIVVPRKLNLKDTKTKLEAYRSSIGNMFTENDITLTTDGYVRQFVDTGYYGDVIKCQTIVETDDLIGGLIDSITNNANTRMNFDLPKNNADEAIIWETWAKIVNSDFKNILPGLSILNEQLITSMLVTGMAVPDFEWGIIKVGKKIFEFPTKIVIQPSLATKLQTSTLNFGEEEVLVSVSKEYEQSILDNAYIDTAYTPRFVEFGSDGKKAMVRTNAYAIKYKYNSNRKTLYPSPLLKRSFESIALRHKYIDADISLLEMIINKIIQIKVGDKDNAPIASKTDENGTVIPGDIELAQELFENMNEVVEVIATPYYYEVEVVMPETTVLLDQKKYVQSTFNIYSNFNILLDPNSGSNSVQFEQLNLKNYEKLAVSIQNHIAGWYLWLAMQIFKRNAGKLKTLPNITFDKPDIYDSKFLETLLSLYQSGSIDVYTLTEKFGLDPKKIKERLLQQQEDEKKSQGLYEARASFKQISQNGNESNMTAVSNGGGKTNTQKIKGQTNAE